MSADEFIVVGKPKAITATAHKPAILVYRTLKNGLVYADPGAHTQDLAHCTRVVRTLRHCASTLGFDLVNRETGGVLGRAVS